MITCKVCYSSGDHLGVGCHELHVGFQELETALLTEQLDELAISAALGGLGVPITVEQAVGDVEDPLLGLPPGPGRPCIEVLRLTLLQGHTKQVGFLLRMDDVMCNPNDWCDKHPIRDNGQWHHERDPLEMTYEIWNLRRLMSCQ